MSAIAGVVQFDGAPIAPGLIERMTAAMASRGPDGISHWKNGFAGMGHCALRATPESLIEVQPLTNEDATMSSSWTGVSTMSRICATTCSRAASS